MQQEILVYSDNPRKPVFLMSFTVAFECVFLYVFILCKFDVNWAAFIKRLPALIFNTLQIAMLT